MKKFIKENKVGLIILAILILCGALSVFRYSNDWDRNNEISKKLVEEHPEINLRFLPKEDTYTVFQYVVKYTDLRFLQLIFPIIVLIPGIINFYYHMKSGIYKDIIIREKYSKYIRKMVLKSWISALIIPFFLVSVFIFSYIFSGNFDVNNTFLEYGEGIAYPIEFIDYPLLFTIVYIFNLGLLGVFYINIGIFFINRNNNFILTIISSFLAILGYQIITEVFLGYLCAKVFNNTLFNNYFSLYNLWSYDGVFNLQSEILYIVILVIASIVLLYFSYKNKESVIIENEK